MALSGSSNPQEEMKKIKNNDWWRDLSGRAPA
jgi:hypothetical protein